MILLYLCFPYKPRRRQWHPTPVLLPGKSHGQKGLVGCSPWGHQESDTTERLHFIFSLSCIGEGNGNPLLSPSSGCKSSTPIGIIRNVFYFIHKHFYLLFVLLLITAPQSFMSESSISSPLCLFYAFPSKHPIKVQQKNVKQIFVGEKSATLVLSHNQSHMLFLTFLVCINTLINDHKIHEKRKLFNPLSLYIVNIMANTRKADLF